MRVCVIKMAANEALLKQADTLWKMLDDLAESNPEGYSKLMDKILKDHKDWLKAPEPVFCLRTLKLPESSNHHIFINICKWDQVPAAKDQGEKISVIASELRDIPDTISKHSAIDLFFHTDIMNQTGNAIHGRKILASMALEYVEKNTGFQLSKNYKILTIKYKGDEKCLKNFMFKRGGLSKRAPGKPSVQQATESKLSSLPSDLHGITSDRKLGKNTSTAKKKPLIEEISSTKPNQVPKHGGVPKHSVEVAEGDGTKSRSIVVMVDLPNVHSGADCELDVSKEDLVLCSAHYSKLQLQFPEKGDETETTAVFNKTTHQLTITIPVTLS